MDGPDRKDTIEPTDSLDLHASIACKHTEAETHALNFPKNEALIS